MRLRVLRSSWGLAGLKTRPSVVFKNLQTHGFDGLEASLSDIGDSKAERAAFVAAAREQGLTLVLSAYSSWPSYEGPFDDTLGVGDHVDGLMREIQEISDLHAAHSSTISSVTAHSGTDNWDDAYSLDFFETIHERVSSLGQGAVPRLTHETHRGRILCCPFATARVLKKLSGKLRLTSDFSHWVVKSERLLDTPKESKMLRDEVAPFVDHLHARIGTPQHPQVANIASPHCAAAAERFYSFWEDVWSAKLAAAAAGPGGRSHPNLDEEVVTATVEYGPIEYDAHGNYAGYMPITADGLPCSGFTHDETLARAATALRARFGDWKHRSGILPSTSNRIRHHSSQAS